MMYQYKQYICVENTYEYVLLRIKSLRSYWYCNSIVLARAANFLKIFYFYFNTSANVLQQQRL